MQPFGSINILLPTSLRSSSPLCEWLNDYYMSTLVIILYLNTIIIIIIIIIISETTHTINIILQLLIELTFNDDATERHSVCLITYINMSNIFYEFEHLTKDVVSRSIKSNLNYCQPLI